MSAVLAIDPGPEESGYAMLDGDRVLLSGVLPNTAMLDYIVGVSACRDGVSLAVEMIASYGMPVGREVFETCVWVGRFQQAWHEPSKVRLIYRRDVKLHLCGDVRAKDPNIRQALIDLLGPAGTKKSPGGTYGVKSHAWAALGVAVTAAASGV